MSIRHADPLLFNEGDLRDSLQNQEQKLKSDIEAYDGNKLLNTPVDDLCGYFAERFAAEPLVLLEEQISTDQRETRLDVSRDRNYHFFPGEGNREVPATAVQFFVPFTGDPLLFKLCPSTRTSNPPRAKVQGSELVFTFVSPDPQGGAIKQEFEQQLNNVRQWIGWGAENVGSHNESLRRVARQAIEGRRERLLRAANSQAALGYPMRRRPDGVQTFIAPDVKRRLLPSPPAANSAPFRPEPTLDNAEYEHILTVIQNMTLVLERSPSTFKGLDEEGIRQHFLVQLNGHYEGAATGETFNGEGKTDILIRQDGKNLFIAECKFWKGSAKFTEAIDQLLSYTSWRDTKTALLVFVRDTSMSTVLAKVPEVLKQHPSFKRDLPSPDTTRFRSVFGQPKDPSRELFVTTLVFNVPG